MEAEALLHRDKCEFFKLFIKLICFKLSAETKHQQFEKKGRRRNRTWPALLHCMLHPPPLSATPPTQLTVPSSTDVGRSRGHVGLALLAAGGSPVRVETHLVSLSSALMTQLTISTLKPTRCYTGPHSGSGYVATRWNKLPSKEHILDTSSFLTTEGSNFE